MPKNCAPFMFYISEENNALIYHTEDHDVTYKLTKYKGNKSKAPERLYQCCKKDPNNHRNYSQSFNFKTKITGGVNNGNIKDVETDLPLKHVN